MHGDGGGAYRDPLAAAQARIAVLEERVAALERQLTAHPNPLASTSALRAADDARLASLDAALASAKREEASFRKELGMGSAVGAGFLVLFYVVSGSSFVAAEYLLIGTFLLSALALRRHARLRTRVVELQHELIDARRLRSLEQRVERLADDRLLTAVPDSPKRTEPSM